jgi:hypothetical protein
MSTSLLVSALLLTAAALDDDQLPPTTKLKVLRGHGQSDGTGGIIGRTGNTSLLGIDSVVNFSSYFYVPGIWTDPYGTASTPQFTWPYTMVGRSPLRTPGGDESEGTTVINAPIIPVAIDLRNADGSIRYCTKADGTKVRLFRSALPHMQRVLDSPIFANARYSSSDRPTQFNDAVHRASFFRLADDDWHTLLRPSVKRERTMTLVGGTYVFATDADCNLVFVLVDNVVFVTLLFPPGTGNNDTTTLVGAAEHDGDMTTTDITTFLFPDTYLYINGDPTQCCVLGFHLYDLEQGDARNGFRERRYVTNYSSWISPGQFERLGDITVLSHEMSEIFADPFTIAINVTPWWLSPNGMCSNVLEVGDVIEDLPNEVFPMTMNGFTYHPQNEALLQWFTSQSPSTAIHHAYSYPDESVLPTAAVSMSPFCGGPAQLFSKQ